MGSNTPLGPRARRILNTLLDALLNINYILRVPSDSEFDEEFYGMDEFGPTTQIRVKLAKDGPQHLSFGFQVLVQPATE